MIRRLLIANRGEIAVRIIQACRELGVESIAVYSEADRRAAHVAAADRAVLVGPAPAAESYLASARILEAARATNADAIHPGYGFLSQSPAFASACEDAGVLFVGPPAGAMSLMGSKIAARRAMEAAGVPVVPGATPSDQSDETLALTVAGVGLPVMIKASAGGGGKGMRLVDRATNGSEIVAAIQSARREAQAAFGDGTLYVERQIDRPYHLEVQVLADAHDQVVHLFERECSVQRRHQKIIEESPSPNITPGLRRRITDAAILAARAASYRNAGTVEFLVDFSGGRRDDAPFYFLEMNTRLQVEHGVTEQVAGVDLVHAQLRVAAGEPLPWAGDALSQRGHAIEARVSAEDPANQFLPQAGRVRLYREPRMAGVRIDSGVREGDEVPVYYDPLLCKVIASAETRELAIARLEAALRAFPILGIRTNIPFLLTVLAHPMFRAGHMHTGFLDGEGAALAASSSGEGGKIPPWVLAAISASESEGSRLDAQAAGWDPWATLRGWRA